MRRGRVYDKYAQVGESAEETAERHRQQKRIAFEILAIVFIIMAAFGFAAFIWYAANGSSRLGTISGVAAVDGNIAVSGGAGVTTVPNTGTGTITIDNNNVRDTLLPYDDPMSTRSAYYVEIVGPENTWLMGNGPGFIPFLLPGVYPGNDGQGNGGITWTVPAPGQYSIHATCSNIFGGSLTTGDNYQYEMVLQLNADMITPNTGTGWEPFGGRDTSVVPSGGGSIVSVNGATTATASFQAGCTGCPANVGDPLTIHLRMNHLGGGSAVSTYSYCYIAVTREK
jgi:hypothetical protein